jgi:excisionase family DNA binding protein
VLDVCPNCKRPAPLVAVFADGSELPSCGECTHVDEPVGYRPATDDKPAPAVAPPPEWLTTADVARELRRSRATVRAYIKAGKLNATGDQQHPYLVHRDDVAAFIEARRAGRTPKRRAQRPRSSAPAGSFRERAKQ